MHIFVSAITFFEMHLREIIRRAQEDMILIATFLDLKSGLQRERERGGGKQSSDSYICWLTPYWISKDRARIGRNQEPSVSLGLLVRMKRGPKSWAIFHCFTQAVSKELDWNWSSLGHELEPRRNAGIPDCRFTYLCHNNGF